MSSVSALKHKAQRNLAAVATAGHNGGSLRLTRLHLSDEQQLLRCTSVLHFLRKKSYGELRLMAQKGTGGGGVITFLVRIRATSRVISDGHHFSPKAFMAEHSSLCMAQSPFYGQKYLYIKLLSTAEAASARPQIHVLPGISHRSKRLSCTSHISPGFSSCESQNKRFINQQGAAKPLEYYG